AAAAAPPQPAAQQHQDPPHIPQQHHYSDYELGMAVTLYEQHYRMDWGLPHYYPPLMAAVKDYRAHTSTPSYYQQYPQQ
ncbi:hypothetical protein A2U01_0095467, partial [Trifolium medium]|nr:hypothetical protein [Trifolium medium]